MSYETQEQARPRHRDHHRHRSRRLTLAGALVGGTATTAAGGTASARAAVAATSVTTTAAVRAATYTAPTRTLKYGMSGSDVKALQQRLAALKYYPGSADGKFGAYTLEAVWAFQEVQGLQARHGRPEGRPGAGAPALLRRPLPEGRLVARGGQPHRTRAGPVPEQRGRADQPHLGRWRLLLLLAQWVRPRDHANRTLPHDGVHPGWITVPLGVMYNSVFFIGTSYAIRRVHLRAHRRWRAAEPGVARLRAHPVRHRAVLPHAGEDAGHVRVHLPVAR